MRGDSHSGRQLDNWGRFARGFAALVAVAPLVLGVGLSPSATAGAIEYAYSGAAMATWSPTDGTVYATVRVGDRVIIGGDFTTLESPDGSQRVARPYLAAIDLTTGAVDNGWTGNVEGVLSQATAVKALAYDGTRLFVGGDFTSINGDTRRGLAALDPRDGSVVKSWRKNVYGGSVMDLAIDRETLYAGGTFWYVGPDRRVRLAAMSTTTGEILDWAPDADHTVRAVAVVPSTGEVVVGGRFGVVGGQPRKYVAMVGADGVVTDWTPDQSSSTCENNDATNPCIPLDLVASADTVYAGLAGPGGRVYSWDLAGNRRWTQWADGDVQALALQGNTLFAGGHFSPTFGGLMAGLTPVRSGLAAMDVENNGALRPYGPLAYGSLGVHALSVDSDGLYLGGDFWSFEGDVYSARFVVLPSQEVHDEQPPTSPASVSVEDVVVAGSKASASVSWELSSDESGIASYRVFRDNVVAGTTKVVVVPAAGGTFMPYVDTTMSQGEEYRFYVAAVDVNGNVSPRSDKVPIVTPVGAP